MWDVAIFAVTNISHKVLLRGMDFFNITDVVDNCIFWWLLGTETNRLYQAFNVLITISGFHDKKSLAVFGLQITGIHDYPSG